MMRKLLSLAALVALALRAPAQGAAPASASEAGVEITLPAAAERAAQAPAVRSVRMLTDRTTRELLYSGFPARLHYRLELWEARSFFDKLVSQMEWDVVVRYDPLARHYTVTRFAGQATTLGTFAELKDAEEAVARPYTPEFKPPTGHAKHYYFVALQVEMLSVGDIDEVQRWLRGDADSALKGHENAGTALSRGAGTLFTRLLGGQKRTYTSRSVVFRPQQE